MTKVIALDLSTKLGFCHDGPGGRPVWGLKLLKVEDWQRLGPSRTQFRKWLIELCAVVQPDLIAFEAALVFGGRGGSTSKTRLEVIRNQFGLADHAEQIADQLGIRCTECTNNEIKSHWVGHGRAEKNEMCSMARRMGCDIYDDNMADALAQWSLVKHSLGESFDWRLLKQPAGELFRETGRRAPLIDVPI